MKNLCTGIKKYGHFILIGMLVIVIVILFIILFREKKAYGTELENKYNMSFIQLVDNVQDIEVYLAKSMISNSSKSGVETLTNIWKEANLAETYLSMLPISSSEIENTAKFLNQVSDYSYTLLRKTLDGNNLSQEDLDNLEKLHKYSVELKNTLNSLANDINLGKISWEDFISKKSLFNNEINNISKNSFSSVEENFHEYAGLIYDGAFSEHMTNPEHKGLTGEDIDENTARNLAIKTIGDEKIKNIKFDGQTENGSIESYNYNVECNDGNMWWISVTKKGGHIIYINSNISVEKENIDDDKAGKMAEGFLEKNGFKNMKKTYFTKNDGIETINYAYEDVDYEEGIIIYPDLIKVKVALDNGEILGMESTGYLNSHTDRNLPEIKISKDDAISKINNNLDVSGVRLAVIPTEFNSEITCWEITGKVDDRDFLVYINVENGEEEDILMIINSSEGTLTM